MATKRKRSCKGKTKRGTRCKAAPLKTGDYCSAHDPDTPASARFGSAEQASRAGAQGGRPPNPRVVDVLKERIEGNIEPVILVLMDGLVAERAIVVGSGESAFLAQVPDHDIRIKAARELLDRAYGRPRTPIEHAGEGGGPIVTRTEMDLKQLSRKERDELEQLLTKAAADGAADAH